MSFRQLFVVVMVVMVAASGQAYAQTTHTGTVSPGATKYYGFTPSVSGQLTATLSWDNQASNLLLVLVCGTSNPMTYGIGSGLLDRFARLESGILGAAPCILAVSTTAIVAAYRLNLQQSSTQAATPQFLSDVKPADGSPLDLRLIEYADAALAVVKSGIR